MVTPQPRGEGADYYQNAPPQGDYGNPQYQMQNPQYESQKYQQQPPEKSTFEQVFTIERPKWNDLWAGILV